MQILTFISNFLVEAAAYNEYFRSGMAYIGAAIEIGRASCRERV